MNINNNCIISKYGISCYNYSNKYIKIIPYFIIAQISKLIIIDCYQKLITDRNQSLLLLDV